nr:hypothetical protein HmN_000419900 [Hymenolepis microstoma]
MSSEQTTQEVPSHSRPWELIKIGVLERMFQQSGTSFAMMLPTLKQYMDCLVTNIELIASLTLYENVSIDAKRQVFAFLLDYGIFLDILAEFNSNVRAIRNKIKALEEIAEFAPGIRPRGEMYEFCTCSCMGYFNYLHASRFVYTNFVRNLQLGEVILRSTSVNFRAKVTVIKFYLEYALEIRVISSYHPTAKFAADSCLILKRANFDNAVENNASPAMVASVDYVRKYHECLENQEYELARTLIPNVAPTPY